jgi:carbonic anhydrase
MRQLSHLFANNRAWASRLQSEDPGFFSKLSRQQAPEYFGLAAATAGAATQIHRPASGRDVRPPQCGQCGSAGDLNSSAALQFAVEVLKVRHIIVCGHYGCGGVRAVLQGLGLGLVDHWLKPVEEVRRKHEAQLLALGNEQAQLDRLCELNVIEQVVNVCQAPTVREAWARGQPLAVHGWIYSIKDGLLRDLGLCVIAPDELPRV